MQQAAAATDVKEQVVDRIPKRIKELKFGIPYAMIFYVQRVRTPSNSALDRFRMFSTKVLWRCVTGIFILTRERKHQPPMVLLTHVWGYPPKMDSAKLAENLSSIVMVTLE